MTSTSIILRKDFQRIRWKILKRIRKGKIRAEKEDFRRIDKVIASLQADGVNVWDWDEDKNEDIAKIMVAVLKEWGGKGGMTTTEVAHYFDRLACSAALHLGEKQGWMKVDYDSYGRKRYYTKK